ANGNLAVCDVINHNVIEMTTEGAIVGTLADSFNGSAIDYPNDCVVDAKGGIYFTAPHGGRGEKMQPSPAVFYITLDRRMIKVIEMEENTYPNGCLLNTDGTIFFLSDSSDKYVWMYDVNSNGTLTNKRTFAELLIKESEDSRSVADGMTIDIEGNLYVASEPGIQIFDRNGEFLGIIQFPKIPSNCVFGGHDMKTLYVTARDHIYAVETNTIGFQFPLK
ncbi:MAG TPA: SMP-30/gluconolactonase/LRE family protein, partial [Anaerolineae bacterium]|nr:SMP-30/gluconolactonase/LRE family protein [Anaerolineae bacterium]